MTKPKRWITFFLAGPLALAMATTATNAWSLETTIETNRRSVRLAQRSRRKAERLATRFSRKNPEVYAALVPADADLTPGSRPVQFLGSQGPVDTVVDSLQQTVLAIGHRELKARDRDHLGRLYSRLYEILPPASRTSLTEPSLVVGGGRGRLRRYLLEIAERLQLDFGPIRGSITQTGIIPGLFSNPIAECSNEIGWESVGSDDENSDRCLANEYASAGIMNTVDFVLKDDLTCVKDQGNRGTCTPHAINANVETMIQVLGGSPENLSEQNLYFWGKIQTDFWDRYDDGLNPDEVYDAMDAQDYELQYEENWNYNQSSSRANLPIGLVYLNSCAAGYTGEMCTNFSFQAQELVAGPGVAIFTYPAPAPSGWEIAAWTSIPDLAFAGMPDFQLDSTILFLESEYPIHFSFDVPGAFTAPDANGYVNYNPGNAALLGSHSALIVGWVENSDLPNGAPADPDGRGYFVVKNSWGITFADCGFVYLSHEFVRRYGTAFRFLDKTLF